MSNEPFPSGDLPGLLRYNPAAIVTTSAATGKTQTFTLPRNGVWLVVVNALIGSVYNNMMTSTWLVNFYDASASDTLLSSQLGATAKSSGSALTLLDLLLSDPTSAGVVTATATWDNGSSNAITWRMDARRLFIFDL